MGIFQAKEGISCGWVCHAEKEAGKVQTCYQNYGALDICKKIV